MLSIQLDPEIERRLSEPAKRIRTDAPPLSLRMALIRSKSGYTQRAVFEFIQLAGRMNWKNLHLLPNPR